MRFDPTQIKFTVLVESFVATEKDWHVALWHNFEDQEKWSSLRLDPVQEPPSVV